LPQIRDLRVFRPNVEEETNQDRHPLVVLLNLTTGLEQLSIESSEAMSDSVESRIAAILHKSTSLVRLHWQTDPTAILQALQLAGPGFSSLEWLSLNMIGWNPFVSASSIADIAIADTNFASCSPLLSHQVSR
jgi:hypothetical protein